MDYPSLAASTSHCLRMLQLLSHYQRLELLVVVYFAFAIARDQRCLFCLLCSQPPCFDFCPYLSPGESGQRKRPLESTLQSQSLAKRVAKGVGRGEVAAERSSPICDGELCGLSFPSIRLGWNRPLPLCCLGCPLWSDVFCVE